MMSSEPKKDSTTPIITFRNYKPSSEVLAKQAVEVTESPDIVVTERLKEEGFQLVEELMASDNIAILPRKANWDLKQEMAPKFAILERRTEEALLKYAREQAQLRKSDASSGNDASGDLDATYTGPANVTSIAQAVERM